MGFIATGNQQYRTMEYHHVTKYLVQLSFWYENQAYLILRRFFFWHADISFSIWYTETKTKRNGFVLLHVLFMFYLMYMTYDLCMSGVF